MPRARRTAGARRAAVCVLAFATVAAPLAAQPAERSTGRVGGIIAARPAAAAVAQAADLPTVTRPIAPQVAPLRALQRTDVLITSAAPLSPVTLKRLAALTAAPSRVVGVRVSTVRVGGTEMVAWGVDPSRFRAFTAERTAKSDAVWQTVADGELAVAHTTAQAAGLTLGAQLPVAARPAVRPTSLRAQLPVAGRPGVRPTRLVAPVPVQAQPAAVRPIRLGALATTGLPGVQVLVSDATASALGFPAVNGAVLSAGPSDPAVLSRAARRVAGASAKVLQLSPAHRPIAVLRGGPAARPLGSFTYRYFADGTIVPDPAWVRANIVTADVPILGRVTCHRLMIPQLRAALAEVERSGLSPAIHRGEYAGCYNPRFIDRNPSQPISLHTWGIALDLNVPGNLRGTRGLIDRRVVAIFKRWGFAWGGDWAYTDPMHFELATLVQPR